jgi:hypothetical protein
MARSTSEVLGDMESKAEKRDMIGFLPFCAQVFRAEFESGMIELAYSAQRWNALHLWMIKVHRDMFEKNLPFARSTVPCKRFPR